MTAFTMIILWKTRINITATGVRQHTQVWHENMQLDIPAVKQEKMMLCIIIHHRDIQGHYNSHAWFL